MIFQSTADPSFNTSPPGGYYAESGWQWQGSWNYGTATIISPDQILTAKHFDPGKYFEFQGRKYSVRHIEDDEKSDLRLVTLDISEHGHFKSWAPIYAGNAERGKEVVVHGRGAIRGEAVVVDDQVKGWRYRPSSQGTLRWGTNEVVGFGSYKDQPEMLLRATFDITNVATECHLADWDSGGGMFIRDDGKWKLAGVNYSVDSLFTSITGNTSDFSAALFDTRGIGQSDGFVMDADSHVASAFFATRVSRRLEWLLPRLTRFDTNQKLVHYTKDSWGEGVMPALAVLGLISLWIISRTTRRQWQQRKH